MCTLRDSTNINTIIEFVPHVSGDGSNGSSDSYLQFRDTCGKRRNINLILDVTPQKEITWGSISSVLCMTPTRILNNPVCIYIYIYIYIWNMLFVSKWTSFLFTVVVLNSTLNHFQIICLLNAPINTAIFSHEVCFSLKQHGWYVVPFSPATFTVNPDPGFDLASNSKGTVKWPVCRADNLTTFMCRLYWNLGASTPWNPQGFSRSV